MRRRLPTELIAERLLRVLRAENALDDVAAFYPAMLERLAVEQKRRAERLDRLAEAFTAMCAITVMLCGLAAAALVG